MKERRPIFYDVERVRWRRTRRVMEITGALLTLLLAYFFVTIAISVELPAGLLPDTKPAYRALKSKRSRCPREKASIAAWRISDRAGELRSIARGVFRELDANSLAS